MQERLWVLYNTSYAENNPTRVLRGDPSTGKNSQFSTKELPFTFRSRLPPKGTELALRAKQDKTRYTVPDNKPGLALKKYHRTVYSPQCNSFEMDIMFAPYSQYLVFVNENTRYLYAVRLVNKSFDLVKAALYRFFLARATDLQSWNNPDTDLVTESDDEITNICAIKIHLVADGEPAWNNARMKLWLDHCVVTYKFNGSPFLHHVPLIDSAIRTIRNAFGLNVRLINDPANMQRVLEYMNNSANKDTKLTPLEMEIYPGLMDSWIRHCIALNAEAKEKQPEAGFHDYPSGAILMVHLDLTLFVGYKHGNAQIRLLDQTLTPEQRVIEVPLYYTRFVVPSKNKIPQAVLNAFNREKIDLTSAKAMVRPGD
jgi:hypothetical protein